MYEKLLNPFKMSLGYKRKIVQKKNKIHVENLKCL